MCLAEKLRRSRSATRPRTRGRKQRIRKDAAFGATRAHPGILRRPGADWGRGVRDHAGAVMRVRVWALLAFACIASGAQGDLGALEGLGRRLAKKSRPVWKPTKQRSPVLTT